MAKNEGGGGFHSAAGLIRYFDEEETTSLKIPPWAVILMCIATAVIVTYLHLIYPSL